MHEEAVALALQVSMRTCFQEESFYLTRRKNAGQMSEIHLENDVIVKCSGTLLSASKNRIPFRACDGEELR
jgi:hypothetical protein